MTRYEKIAQEVWAGRTDTIASLASLPDEDVRRVAKVLETIKGVKLDLRSPSRKLHRAIAVARAR